MKANIKSYQDAKDFLKGKKSRPYAHNTRIIIDSMDLGHEVITVTYHDNPVVNFFSDGTVTYSSCGWKTSTTKERINWFLPDGFRLYQEKSRWYLSSVPEWDWNKATRYNWADGIAIKSGIVYNAAEEDETPQTIKAIKKYVDGYIKALISGKVEKPSGGDCWYCAMVTEKGEGLGDVTKNTDHILSHFEESYYVPSLLMRAYDFNKRMSIMAKDGVARLWEGESISEWQESIVTRDVKACLTSYLKHVLNIAQ